MDPSTPGFFLSATTPFFSPIGRFPDLLRLMHHWAHLMEHGGQ